MTRFEPGDLVRVPYPHVARPVVMSRPALVDSGCPLGPDGLLIWTMMITNAAREDWPGDLVVPSKIRKAKIAAVEAARATRIGVLPHATMELVHAVLRQALSL